MSVLSNLSKLLNLCLARFCFIVCAMALLTVAPAAQSDRWYLIGQSADKNLWYLDRDSIENFSDGVRYWDQNVFPDGSYISSRTVIYCRSKKKQTLESFVYAPSGDVLGKNDGGELINIPPDSVVEMIFQQVCPQDGRTGSKITVTGNKNVNNNNNKKNNSGTRKRPVRQSKLVEVIAELANIRRTPSLDGEILVTASRGLTLRLVQAEAKGGWYQILLGEQGTGWIHGNTIKFVEIESPAK